MLLISHRGNISGPQPKLENTVAYIEQAIDQGYNVEIDVWFKDGKFFLGHDAPEEHIEKCWFYNKPLWCHCKNYSALKELLELGVHCFFHDKDDYTLTSEGFIWAYPGKMGEKKTIAVMPDDNFDISNFEGVCSDNIEKFRNKKND